MTVPAEALLQQRPALRRWWLTALNALTTAGCAVAHRLLRTHRKRAAVRLLLPWRIAMLSVLSPAFAANADAVDTLTHRDDPTSRITFLPLTGDSVDPINLIFVHNGTRQAVQQALVAQGWYRFLASEQWMHFPGPRLWKPQDADYFYGNFRQRYHIRIFASEVYTTLGLLDSGDSPPRGLAER